MTSAACRRRLTFPVTAGVPPSLLRVAGYNSTRGTGTFSISAAGSGGGPPNDNCVDAVAVSDGVTAVTNVGATLDGPSTCGLLGADVWYRYTATCTGSATATTCLPESQLRHRHVRLRRGPAAVHRSGATTTARPPAPFPASPFSGSTVIFPVVAGNQYLIQVGGFNGATGNTDLTISCSLPAGNDACADATAITGPGPHGFDNSSATTDGLGDPLCLAFGLDNMDSDVWFCWTRQLR
jgi:hypothetical protein